MSKGRDYLELREKYPRFIYTGYSITNANGKLCLSYHFEIPGLAAFNPRWEISGASVDINDRRLNELAFSLGMVELVSYWKTACPPEVEIACGSLSHEQAQWWKKLYKKGLGEFFYVNGIDPDSNFMTITSRASNDSDPSAPSECASNDRNPCASSDHAGRNNDARVLVPIGGGKDSAVTLELLRACTERTCYIINPRKATLDTFERSGVSNLIIASRTLDGNMLALNKQGFLNGHTPFSALVAFSSVLAAYINGLDYVALSNESSANEPTVLNTDVNHQYSKSYEFETDFINYEAQYISSGVKYFSLLRPLTEIGIAKMFSRLEHYHSIFQSCNVASKQDRWCAACPKCLFVYIILSPFMPQSKLTGIFGRNMLDDAELLPIFEQLIGVTPEKPFECVGSRDEVGAALQELIRQYELNPLPYLAKYYKELNVAENHDISAMCLSYDENNHVPQRFVDAIKSALK